MFLPRLSLIALSAPIRRMRARRAWTRRIELKLTEAFHSRYEGFQWCTRPTYVISLLTATRRLHDTRRRFAALGARPSTSADLYPSHRLSRSTLVTSWYVLTFLYISTAAADLRTLSQIGTIKK